MTTKVITEVEAKAKISGDKEVISAYVQMEQAGDRLEAKTQSQAAATTRQAAAEQSLTASLRQRSAAADESLKSTEDLFKATDRANSIVGKVTAAFGLAGLVAGALKGAYNALTDAAEKRAKAERDHARALADTESRMQAIARAAPKVIQALGVTNFLSLTPEERARTINLQRDVDQELSARIDAEQKLAGLVEEVAKTQAELRERQAAVEQFRNLGQQVPGRTTGAIVGLERRLSILQAAEAEQRTNVDRFTRSSTDAARALEELTVSIKTAAGDFDFFTDDTKTKSTPADRERRLQSRLLADDLSADPTDTLQQILDDDPLAALSEALDADALIAEITAADQVIGLLGMTIADLSASGTRGFADLAAGMQQSIADLSTSVKSAESGVKGFTDGIQSQSAAAVFDLLVLGGTLQEAVGQLAIGIGRQAAIKLPFAIAEGFSALGLTGGIPNPASTAHFTAAKIYAAIAVGGGLVGSALGGGGGGDGGGLPGGGAFAPTAPTPPGGGSGDTHITLYVETGLATKEDVANAVLDVLPAAGRTLGRTQIPRRLMERQR